MSYKIHNEKNYSDNTSLRDVNDDVTELLTSGNRKVDYAIQTKDLMSINNRGWIHRDLTV
ncbi:13598_t:CDS:2, partial [Gigaspora rosea]